MTRNKQISCYEGPSKQFLLKYFIPRGMQKHFFDMVVRAQILITQKIEWLQIQTQKNRMAQDTNPRKWVLRIKFSVTISYLY